MYLLVIHAKLTIYVILLSSPSPSPSPPVPKGPQLNPKKVKVKSYFWTGLTLQATSHNLAFFSQTHNSPQEATTIKSKGCFGKFRKFPI